MRTHNIQSSSDSTSTPHTRHVSVLSQQVQNVLDIQHCETVVDCTLGGGGHARMLAEQLDDCGTFVGFDADSAAIARAQERLHGVAPTCHFINANFRQLREALAERDIARVDAVLFDLGLSSDQLEQSGRGFSFDRDEPLAMTFADAPTEGTLTAEEILMTWEEQHLADIFYGWGGERFARRIARAIVATRAQTPITTTQQLVDIVTAAIPARFRSHKRNPATKVFQALRIAVNDELDALETALAALPDVMAPNGRVAIISFHSIEDRVVKETFRTWERNGLGNRITRKPITPEGGEVSNNPRARSAKLRAFVFTHYEQAHSQ